MRCESGRWMSLTELLLWQLNRAEEQPHYLPGAQLLPTHRVEQQLLVAPGSAYSVRECATHSTTGRELFSRAGLRARLRTALLFALSAACCTLHGMSGKQCARSGEDDMKQLVVCAR